jgi:hypothetical protein
MKLKLKRLFLKCVPNLAVFMAYMYLSNVEYTGIAPLSVGAIIGFGILSAYTLFKNYCDKKLKKLLPKTRVVYANLERVDTQAKENYRKSCSNNNTCNSCTKCDTNKKED